MTSTAARIVLGALVGCVLGLVLTASGALERVGLRGPRPSPSAAATLPSIGEEGHSSFALLARRAAPGVVNVHTSKTVVRSPVRPPFPGLFGNPFGRYSAPTAREVRVPSLGTGFIISADGYIVTNNHVVDGVDTIDVMFSDGSEASAAIVGQDPKTDLALIRVANRQDLHALPLGDSDAILPGDWVIAIGNPFGLGQTVTVGIVSAKGRDIGQAPYDDLIQTDAAINPGNSGGPLLNTAGEVIGINTLISPDANTIGFALPINLAKEIVPQLQASGRVIRGFLGVKVQPLTAEIAAVFGLPGREGALIRHVEPGGPAESGGLRRGDVIVGYRGQRVRRIRDLPRAVSRTAVGSEVDVEIIREGSPHTVTVRIAELPDPELARLRAMAARQTPTFGLRVEDPVLGVRQRLGMDARGGVVIAAVDPNSGAAQAGLQPGDALLELNRRAIENSQDLRQRLERAGPRVLFLVLRGSQTLFVPVARHPS